jgi:hypothetical protein
MATGAVVDASDQAPARRPVHDGSGEQQRREQLDDDRQYLGTDDAECSQDLPAEQSGDAGNTQHRGGEREKDLRVHRGPFKSGQWGAGPISSRLRRLAGPYTSSAR